jgi:hypothetical protein
MYSQFAFSLLIFSFALGSLIASEPEKKSSSTPKKENRQVDVAQVASSTNGADKKAQPLPDSKERKKPKAHFAGSKRPPQNHLKNPVPVQRRKSSRVKNEWVVSKTHPKTRAEKKAAEREKLLAKKSEQSAAPQGKADQQVN